MVGVVSQNMCDNVVIFARERKNSSLKKAKGNFNDFLDKFFPKIYKQDNFELLYLWDHSFGTYAIFSENLTS